MKKKGWIAIIGGLIIAAIVVFVFSGQKPYKNLKASDIVSAAVHLSPPDETVRITEVEELVSYLNEVVTYKKDDSYREYSGQAVIFTLTMADGSQEEITAFNPFLIINGSGYQTKYEPCEKLNNYANELLRRAE